MQTERGSALISVLLFVTVVSILAVPLFNSVLQDRIILEMENVKTQNHYAVESGLELIKATQPNSNSDLETAIEKVNNLNLSTVVDSDVVVDLESQSLVIKSEGNRQGTDIEARFGYRIGDVFTANLFVAAAYHNNKKNTLSISPSGKKFETNYYASNIDVFLADEVGDEVFEASMMDIVNDYDPPVGGDEVCLGEAMVYEYIYCINNGDQSKEGSGVLTINGDVYIEDDLYLNGFEEVIINGNVYVEGDITFDYVRKVTIKGDLISFGGDISIRGPGSASGGSGIPHNTNTAIYKIEVTKRFVAYNAIGIFFPSNTIHVKVRSLAAGGLSSGNNNGIIGLHANNEDIDIFYDFEVEEEEITGTLWITHWDVQNR